MTHYARAAVGPHAVDVTQTRYRLFTVALLNVSRVAANYCALHDRCPWSENQFPIRYGRLPLSFARERRRKQTTTCVSAVCQ